jgi:uncharacterized protein
VPAASTPVTQPSLTASLISRLIRFQTSRPLPVLLVIGAGTALSLVLATRLTLLTGFESLLPESRPSVIELRRVSARTSSLSTIFVVLEGQDPAGLRRASDALLPALRALGSPWVGQVEDGVHDVIRFVEPRAGLFTDLRSLEKLRDDVEARYAHEVGQRSGFLTGIEENPPPPFDAAAMRQWLGVVADSEERFPGGCYQSRDGKTVVIVIRCGILGGDVPRGREALAKVREVVAHVNPRNFDPAARWGLSGDLAIFVAEYTVISHDLMAIGIAGALLILGVVLLYYLRFRTGAEYLRGESAAHPTLGSLEATFQVGKNRSSPGD